MKWTPVPIACDANEADVRPKSVMVPVNYLTVIAKGPGERSDASLEQLPGCAVFTDLGTGDPIRGLYNCEGNLYAVSGSSLFRITPRGVVTNLGTIPGRKRVTFAHNQITAGNQIVIATGSTAYVFNTKTEVLAQITDSGFPGAKMVAFVDGYIVFVDQLGRYWGHSALANAMEYNTLDRSEAESQPDKIVGIGVSHREVAVFGERTVEFYRNIGDTEGAFERINGTEMERGCAAAHSIVSIDNSLVWLGDDGCVYRLDGYQPVRISTQSIEEKIARWNKAEAFAFAYEQPGHKIYYITFTDGQTLGYDFATGLWHRRKWYGLDFWRMGALVKWNGVWIGGDYANGKLYQLDRRVNNDAGEPLERIARFAVAHDSGNRFGIDAVRFWFNTGETDASDPLPQLVIAPEDRLSIAGDVPDGYPGMAVTGAYVAAGGVPPYGNITVASGTFPPGLTLATNGTYTGTYTTAGSWSWVVQVTDAGGNVATVADTAVVADTKVLLMDDGDVTAKGPRAALTSAGASGITGITSESKPQYALGGFVLYQAASSWFVAKYNTATDTHDAVTITGTKYGSTATISPDGQYVVSCVASGGNLSYYVYAWDGAAFALDSGPVTGATYSFGTGDLVFSPDGTKIAHAIYGYIHIHTFAAGTFTVGTSKGFALPQAPFIAWSPNSLYIAAIFTQPAPSDGVLTVFNASTRLTIGSNVVAASGNRSGVVWGTNAHLYCSGDYNGGAPSFLHVAFDAVTGLSMVSRNGSAYVSNLSVTPDAQWLAVAEYDSGFVRTYALDTSGNPTLSQTFAAGNRSVLWINHDLPAGAA